MEGFEFDVVVVGAGVAGSVCAHRLARAGCSVALLERGEQAGQKNLSGGVLFPEALCAEFPDFAVQAPLERTVTRHVLGTLTSTGATTIDLTDAVTGAAGPVTVLRARLDAWLAERCEEAGVLLMTGVRVDDVLIEGGRAVGVRAGDEELRARVVVLADGVRSELARRAGVREAPTPSQLALGVKSVIALDAARIEERFGLAPGEGASHHYIGAATQGLPGGGFVYTNRESVSVGIVVKLDALAASGASAADLHDGFCEHPRIRTLLAGGELVEYGAHLTIEDGPALAARSASAPGLLIVGDAAGFTLNEGFVIRGMDLAAISARAAADAIAADPADVDGLPARYRAALDAAGVVAELATHARRPDFLARARLYDTYPEALAKLARAAVHPPVGARRPPLRAMLGDAGVRWPTVVRDVVAALRKW